MSLSLIQALVVYVFNPLIGFLVWVVIIRVVMSWLIAYNVINLQNQFVAMIWQVCGQIYEPMVRPIRQILPNFSGIDFSPFVLILLLQFIKSWLLPGIAFGTLRLF